MAIGPVPRATTPSWPRGGAAGACRRAIGARPRRCSAASATGGAAACGRGIGDTPVMATRDLKRREAGAPSPGDRRPVGADQGERSGLRLRRRRADRGPKAPCAHRQARPGRPPRRGAGPRRRARGVARHPRPSAPTAPRLRPGCADGGQAGPKLRAAGERSIAVVKRSDAAEGFEVVPRRWIVERIFARPGRCRRQAKDRPRSVGSAKASVFVADVGRPTRRLASCRLASWTSGSGARVDVKAARGLGSRRGRDRRGSRRRPHRRLRGSWRKSRPGSGSPSAPPPASGSGRSGRRR